MSRDILNVSFADEGMIITYMDVPGDVRAEGALIAQHQLAVSGQRYLEELAEVYEVCQRTLTDMLDDFGSALPYEPGPDDDDDDDDRGMGDR